MVSLLSKIKAEKLVFGTFITSPNPLWPNALQRAGLDFVFIDTEHIPIARNELAHICQKHKGRGITPVMKALLPDTPFDKNII
ncbi:hypothetical protein [Cyclobacterium sp.]|uniref:hypothetical protein n=1 Tax=Cyclobacterium sp. TaxID=1966343 RepID=UPI001985178B|nr:hypothetical protein [Cyclobacterium sp.]MBD3628369.1 hypothetical protein [Cyclobacterium sp.]